MYQLYFRSDEEVVTAVEEWVNGKDPDFFSSLLMALEHRWSKCMTPDKQKTFVACHYENTPIQIY